MILPLSIDDYNYELPKEKIAEFPLEKRDSSKLLLVNSREKKISHHQFSDIASLLTENSTLIVNNTKVIPARLYLKKTTGGFSEIFCVLPEGPINDPQRVMSVKGECIWTCLVGGKNIRPGTVLQNEDTEKKYRLYAEIVTRQENEARVRFFWNPFQLEFGEILNVFGVTPLPLYIKRQAIESDKNNYQTVYAKNDGSVAAPTAGLHFTEKIIKNLKKRKISVLDVTLHVGTGTFYPVTVKNITEHKMHKEQIIIEKTFVQQFLKKLNGSNDSTKNDMRFISTGTTTLRTVESLYWYGVKLFYNLETPETNGSFFIGQWEPYYLMEKYKPISVFDSFEKILVDMKNKGVSNLKGFTEFMIVPGYQFKVFDALITNFHLPKSTLLMLVSAFIGDNMWRTAYNEALNNNYRFLSYGDSSLLIR